MFIIIDSDEWVNAGFDGERTAFIMAYYTCGDDPQKMVDTLKVRKWHDCSDWVKSVKAQYEIYQALPSASMSNGTVNYVCVCFQEKCYKVCFVTVE